MFHLLFILPNFQILFHSKTLADRCGRSQEKLTSFMTDLFNMKMSLLPGFPEKKFVIVMKNGHVIKTGLDDPKVHEVMDSINFNDGNVIAWKDFQTKSDMDDFLEENTDPTFSEGPKSLPSPG